MRKVLALIVLVPAVLFFVLGVRWLVMPWGIAPDFGLALDRGVGLSSQVGDLSAYFLTLGICILIALLSGRRSWYYPPIILLSLTSVGRIVAWSVHDAALAINLILPEVAVVLLLILTSRYLPVRD